MQISPTDLALPAQKRTLPEFHRQPLRAKRLAAQLGLIAGAAAASVAYGAAFVRLPPSYYLPLMAPFGLLALLIVWALPERAALSEGTRSRMVGLFFALAAASVLWPNYLSISLPGLPWISLRRLISAPLILIFLAALSTVPAFRREIGTLVRSAPATMRVLIAFVLFQFLSIPFSRDFAEAMKVFVNWQVTWTAIFFISAFVFARPGAVERWVKLLLWATFILCLMGLVESRFQRVLWADHIPAFLKIDDPAVQTMLAGGFKGDQYRVQTTFALSLSFAEFLAMMSAFCLHYILNARTFVVRGLMVAFDALILVMILLTVSRLGLVGFLVTHAVSGLIWGLRKWRNERTSLVAPTVVLAYPAFLVVLAAVVMTVPAVHNRVLGGGATQASTEARHAQWRMAVPKIISRPLGHGPGQGARGLGYTNLAGQMTLDSYYLLILLDFGILGFLAFYGMLLLAAYQAVMIGTRHAVGELSMGLPIASAILGFIVMRYVLILGDNNTLTMMLVGMVVGLAYRDRQIAISGRDVKRDQTDKARQLAHSADRVRMLR